MLCVWSIFEVIEQILRMFKIDILMTISYIESLNETNPVYRNDFI